MLQDFVQRIKDTIQEELQDVHTAFPAKIVSVDASSGLATVQPSIKKKLDDGSTIDFPPISGVPVLFLQGANQYVSIAIPVKSGDSCLLIVSEQSLEYWLYGRETDTTLPFDITNAVCIPGLFQKPPSTFFEACNNNATVITSGLTKLTIGSSGVVINGSLTINGDLNITGRLNYD